MLQAEKDLSFSAALRLYPKAIGWSVLFSVGVMMLAFDPQLLGGLDAMPAFQEQFGEEHDGAVSDYFYTDLAFICNLLPLALYTLRTTVVLFISPM